MPRRQPLPNSRSGFSLMEAMASVAIMSTLMVASTVVLRSTYTLWQHHESDLEQAEMAHSVLRHIVRTLRQSDAVLGASASSDAAGTLRVLTKTGDIVAWERNAGTNQVLYGVEPASVDVLLADEIQSLNFECLQADGDTVATNLADTQTVRCTVGITMPTGTSRTVTCYAWLRSW